MKNAEQVEARARWLAKHVLPLEPALRGWLRRARHADFDIDDIIQETYARLVQAKDLEGVVQVRAYIFRTTSSVLADQFRKRTVVTFVAASELADLTGAIDHLTPEDHAQSRNELSRLLDRLALLPDKTRSLFMLSRVNGLSMKAVASQTGVPESTVEKHVAKALRHLMEDHDDGGEFIEKPSHSLRTERRMRAARSKSPRR